MASLYSSPSSSCSSSSYSNPFLTPTVTQEEFNAFHHIDRVLFTKLVLNLERDPEQSIQVVALWIWLERSSHADNFVHKMLSLPDTLINSMADEAVVCLNCIENDQLHFTLDAIRRHDNIPLIHCVSKTGISLQYFHRNRIAILRAISKIVQQVCLRAFDDILKHVEILKTATIVGHDHQGRTNSHEMYRPFPFYGPPPMVNPAALPIVYGHPLGSSQIMPGPGGGGQGYSGNSMHGFDPAYPASQRQVLNDEIGDVLGHNMQICATEEERNAINNVPVDDRTIFLTFSKGYPISEIEVREFFTRKYGDCIEAIHMQEVMVEDHQPLYARLIVHSPTLLQVVLEGKSKAKFSINGKHVWARKYIKKSLSPPQAASPSHPASPAATPY